MVAIQNKAGLVFEIIPYEDQAADKLVSFYDLFEPKGEYQGIPPVQKHVRERWIKEIKESWQNFLILRDDRVVGHVAVAHEGGPLKELIIFLHQDYRGQGVGTKALGHIEGWLLEKGCKTLWLTVQNTNTPAIRCFRKVGFSFQSPLLEPEREMVLNLEKPK